MTFRATLVSVFSCEPKICDQVVDLKGELHAGFQCSRVNRRYVTINIGTQLLRVREFQCSRVNRRYVTRAGSECGSGAIKFQCSRVNRRYVTADPLRDYEVRDSVSVFSCEPKICDQA